MRGLILICVVAVCAPLSAITIRPLSFTELVDGSAAVVHGRVSSVHGQWTADRHGIDSLVSLDVIDYLKGGLGERVTVRVPGGQVGGMVNVIPGAPKFVEGDQVVLFLKVDGPAIPVVTGTTQGVYRVTTDPRSGGLVVVPPVVDAAGAGRVVRGDVNRRPLAMDVFSAAVKSAQVAR
jgi:hypothetical protein